MAGFASEQDVMLQAIALARRGFGRVEPNPMVGAVVVSPVLEKISEGWHQQFGEAHAEIHAIRAAGAQTRGADLFVTLEPCSHFGKTPPCVDAVIAAGFRRVFIGCSDPAEHVAGRGIQKLRDSGIDVTVGLCQHEARRLIAPFARLMLQRLPWVHAKWAMTLDGRIATRTGHSRWISGEASRSRVHELRGCMDAIITGSGTVRTDDPLLTARPPGPRTALRVVVDATGESLTDAKQLVRTVSQGGVLVCVNERSRPATRDRLCQAGIEILQVPGHDQVDLKAVLAELGQRRMTNVLLEAGPGLLGSFFDAGLIDEVHAFVAPKLIGGSDAKSPVAGLGLESVPALANIQSFRVQAVGADLLIEGDCCRENTDEASDGAA